MSINEKTLATDGSGSTSPVSLAAVGVETVKTAVGLPVSLRNDPSFWGMTSTQFLGAFNDNLFKQVALLLCVDYSQSNQTSDQQATALLIFAIPFVAFSGFAGFLSDRYSKRGIIVLCKLAEIAIVILGTLALWRNSHTENLYAIFAVLFLMGTHSAFFGPPKYGILPEIIREKNLPAANGIFLMTTFVAIIVGTIVAGLLKQYLMPDYLLVVGGVYVLVAAAGLATSLLVRKTPPANPNLKIETDSLLVSREMLRLMWRDRPLLLALLMSSVFWLVGGIIQPTVNAFGKKQLGLSDSNTSLMPAALVVGISCGCLLGGWLSRSRVNFRLVQFGSWGMVVGLTLLAVVGASGRSVAVTRHLAEVILFGCGIAAGVFAVPLQVFLQSRPPADKKGQMIGAMNLVNWIAILFSSVLYGAFQRLLVDTAGATTWKIFGATAVFLLPIAIFYRPRADGQSS
ncbi:MAG: MFS transporter [Planctomycetaceae bacterium]|nr:MAG: MFS transporter [Planctomycetaceae bacterium]